MQYLLRNKIIAFCIGTLFLLPNITQGQRYLDLNMLDHDEKKFHFGIKLGANKSFYHFYNSNNLLEFKDILSVQSIQNTGINLGWLVNMRLSDFFDLRTYPIDLIFTEKSFLYTLKNNTDTLKKIQGITLALPLQVKFCSERIDNIKVYLMAGGKMEYDFAANSNSNSGKLSERQQVKLKKMDYGIEAGIGFHFYFPVFVLTPEIKASWGLRDMHIRDNDLKYSNVIDRISSRVYSISLVIE